MPLTTSSSAYGLRLFEVRQSSTVTDGRSDTEGACGAYVRPRVVWQLRKTPARKQEERARTGDDVRPKLTRKSQSLREGRSSIRRQARDSLRLHVQSFLLFEERTPKARRICSCRPLWRLLDPTQAVLQVDLKISCSS